MVERRKDSLSLSFAVYACDVKRTTKNWKLIVACSCVHAVAAAQRPRAGVGIYRGDTPHFILHTSIIGCIHTKKLTCMRLAFLPHTAGAGRRRRRRVCLFKNSRRACRAVIKPGARH